MNIKSFLFIFLILFFSIFANSAIAQEDTDTPVQQFVFELDDAAQVIEGSVEITQEKPFLSDYIEQEETYAPQVMLETDFRPTYRVNQIKKVSTYSKSLESPSSSDLIIGKDGKDGFSVTSRSYQYNDTNTLIKNVRQELGATVKKDRFSLTGGLETTYDTTSVNAASRGAFITPKLQLGDRAAISFKNKISGNDLTKYEPTVGIDYKPKLIKNTNIWMGAGATIRDNNIQSQTLNLKTDFYIF